MELHQDLDKISFTNVASDDREDAVEELDAEAEWSLEFDWMETGSLGESTH